jgi:hypothetical protein
MSFAGKRSSGRRSASSAAARQLAGDASRDAALTRTDISVAPAVTVSNPRTGARVEQRREWDPDELMGDIKERTAYADASRSEWLSEWGERPTGAHENDRPAWRGGGLAPNRRTPPEAETRAARPRPVPIVPLGSTPSVGAAQVEADIRRWLVANRALHETKRITLIRVLGAGLQPEEPEEEGNDPGGRTRERGTRRNGDETRRRRTINGLPLDASGRPVGVRATFPDPRYASVAPDGVPLPVEERTRFIPKPLPPSKRSYHPSAPLPLGPRASRDGTWDSPRDDPREIGDLEALRAEGRRVAPAATLTRAQFARAIAVGMGTPVSSHDVEDIFDTRAVSGLVPNETVLILEAFADAVLATPLRVMGGPGATIEDDGPERPESYAGKIVAPPCRTALFAPSDWNGAAARTSNAAPEEDLELEWAHGVSVAGGAGMLKWAPKWRADDPSSSFGAAGETREENAVRKRAEGWWVYACGAMGVALETAATTPRGEREVRTPGSEPSSETRRASRSSQRFFRGHDERVTSLDVHPSGRWAATGQAGRVPQVAVWEIASGREVARVRLAAGDGRVAAVAFGPGDGDVAPGGVPARVVAVAADAKHTTRVWDWGGRVARRGATFPRPRVRRVQRRRERRRLGRVLVPGLRPVRDVRHEARQAVAPARRVASGDGPQAAGRRGARRRANRAPPRAERPGGEAAALRVPARRVRVRRARRGGGGGRDVRRVRARRRRARRGRARHGTRGRHAGGVEGEEGGAGRRRAPGGADAVPRAQNDRRGG